VAVVGHGDEHPLVELEGRRELHEELQQAQWI
jgi:hypothetical protein